MSRRHGSEDYMTGFNAIKAELCARFGPDDGYVHSFGVPLYLDPPYGNAESLTFRSFAPGVACCTCGLCLDPEQKVGPAGNFERMSCTREEAGAFPGSLAISRGTRSSRLSIPGRPSSTRTQRNSIVGLKTRQADASEEDCQ